VVERRILMAKTRATASPAAPKPRTAKKKSPTQEEIALHAYHIFLKRNGAPGDPHADWLQAERELLEALTKPKAKPRRKATVTPIAA
jgi:hypothetical protein